MGKRRLYILLLKTLLLLSIGLISLALSVSCTGPTEEAPAPTEEVPAPPTAEPIPPATLFDIPEMPSEIEETLFRPGPAVDCFAKVEGLSGESTDDKHKDWIDVLSWSWGVSQSGTMATASGTGRLAERADLSEFSIIKTVDRTSPKLALYCSNGNYIEKVTIELCHTEDGQQKFMEYKLEDVIIASVKPSGSRGEAMPLEEVSFSYGKITWTYTEMDPLTGKPKGEISAYWDLVANKGE
jgi:type VI secretion system secreted protein Hcp